MEGNGQILIPGSASINVLMHDGPNAQQIVVNLQKPTGLEVHIFGGLTKVQQLAGEIAGHLCVAASTSNAACEGYASQAVNLAEAILAATAPKPAIEQNETQSAE